MTDTALLLALLAIPLLGGLATWGLRSPTVIYAAAVTAHLAVLLIGLALLGILLAGHEPHAFGNWLYLDHLGGVVLLIVICVSFLASLYSVGYLRQEVLEGAVRTGELRRYFALFHAFVFTMLVSSVSGNLGLLWTAIAATTISSAPLVDFYGTAEPLEAAWKYILLTTAGSMVALVGFLLLYQAGSTLLGGSYDFTVPTLVQVAPRLPAAIGLPAFLLVLVGLGTKAGLAPMHFWLPDAHSQAPSPVCALLSGAELNCAMLGILRVYALVAPGAGPGRLRGELLAFGLLSVVLGVAFLISQRDFKRLLAYSSIENMGLVAVGLGVGGPLAVFGALLQMINHAFAKSLMFFGTGNLLLRYRTRTIDQVGGVVRLMPVTGTVAIFGVLALAGVPPFGPFLSEFSIVTGALSSHQWWPGLLVPFMLLVAFVALVFPFHRMVLSTPPTLGPGARAGNAGLLVPLYLALAFLLVLGVWIPGPLRDLLTGAARAVGS
jgi:hydrogenase-4 component F